MEIEIKSDDKAKKYLQKRRQSCWRHEPLKMHLQRFALPEKLFHISKHSSYFFNLRLFFFFFPTDFKPKSGFKHIDSDSTFKWIICSAFFWKNLEKKEMIFPTDEKKKRKWFFQLFWRFLCLQDSKWYAPHLNVSKVEKRFSEEKPKMRTSQFKKFTLVILIKSPWELSISDGELT